MDRHHHELYKHICKDYRTFEDEEDAGCGHVWFSDEEDLECPECGNEDLEHIER